MRWLNTMNRRWVKIKIKWYTNLECSAKYHIQFHQPLLQFCKFIISPQGVILPCHRIYYPINVDFIKFLNDGFLQNLGLHVNCLRHHYQNLSLCTCRLFFFPQFTNPSFAFLTHGGRWFDDVSTNPMCLYVKKWMLHKLALLLIFLEHPKHWQTSSSWGIWEPLPNCHGAPPNVVPLSRYLTIFIPKNPNPWDASIDVFDIFNENHNY